MEQLIDFHAPEVQAVLDTLLKDRSTGKNIIWATDDYAELGEQYSFKKEILPELVTGEQDSLIQPRVEKALEHQTNRTRDKAEVFTPQLDLQCTEQSGR